MSLLWSTLVGMQELRRCEEPKATCVLRSRATGVNDQSAGASCLELTRVSDAVAWLQSSLVRPDDVAALRRVLATDVRNVAWLSNQQVLEQVAAKIVRRELCVVIAERLARETAVHAPASPPPAATGSTPSQLRGRASEPLTSAVQEKDFAENLDQNRQAKALEEAAKSGVPFCEECEKADKANAA